MRSVLCWQIWGNRCEEKRRNTHVLRCMVMHSVWRPSAQELSQGGSVSNWQQMRGAL
ncbi:hypothetical protein O3G_MSEX015394 [Manduca sexta]|uniref:Uncharacterized protein n=1 Tax=Manduca sexta TaxID=7130 RepID=A0A922A0J0_MANSE|nr:hypothetical protein O3G_MSEX015394 [Manduca sexta]